MELIGKFFATARERYSIKLLKEEAIARQLVGASEETWNEATSRPLTQDPVFAKWRFCNVHREDDRTTVWLRDNIRTQLRGQRLFDAIMVFRWFNRIETGEILKDLLLEGWRVSFHREAWRRLEGVRPVVTGAYMLKTPDGYPKGMGVLKCIEFVWDNTRDMVGWSEDFWTIQSVTEFLARQPYMGTFTGYEIATDLRHTHWLERAPDIMTWASPGPGCARGLGRVVANDRHHFSRTSDADKEKMLDVMRSILGLSRNPQLWPQAWKSWEMREVEHWACEFDKYERAALGAPMRRRYP